MSIFLSFPPRLRRPQSGCLATRTSGGGSRSFPYRRARKPRTNGVPEPTGGSHYPHQRQRKPVDAHPARQRTRQHTRGVTFSGGGMRNRVSLARSGGRWRSWTTARESQGACEQCCNARPHPRRPSRGWACRLSLRPLLHHQSHRIADVPQAPLRILLEAPAQQRPHPSPGFPPTPAFP